MIVFISRIIGMCGDRKEKVSVGPLLGLVKEGRRLGSFCGNELLPCVVAGWSLSSFARSQRPAWRTAWAGCELLPVGGAVALVTL